MRRTWTAIALAAMVSAGALAVAGPAGARKGPPEFFGIVPQGNFPTNADFRRMGRADVGTVRLVANWKLIEPRDDAWNFGSLDAYIGKLAAAGIRPFPVLFHTAPFVNSDDLRLPVRSGRQKEQWKEFVAMVVQRYGAGGDYWTTVYEDQHPGEQPMPVTTWQVWNEENGPKHVHDPNPGQYAELVKISGEAVESEDAGADVVLGGMFGTPTGRGGIKAKKFLNKMYETAGVKEAFDGVAIHPYSPGIKGIKEQIADIRGVLQRNQDVGADVWLTELGWGSSKKGRLGVGRKKQSKLLKKAFKLALKKRGTWNLGGVMWYAWRDLRKTDAPCDWCASAGLVKRNGTKAKPALKKYVRFTGGT